MNKTLLCFFAGLLSLAGCSRNKNAVSPAPSLVGSWTWSDTQRVTTPLNGGSSTTSSQHVASGYLTLTFTDAGTYSSASTSGLTTNAGTYNVSGPTLTMVPGGITTPSTIVELTEHRLVLVGNYDDSANRYVITDTYTR